MTQTFIWSTPWTTEYEPSLPSGTQLTFPPPKCECGIDKVMGEDYPAHRHSDWCPKYQPEPKEIKNG